MPGENNAVFSKEEKARIRYHMGYTSANPVTSIQLGIPAVGQAGFLVEGQMDRIPISAAGVIRDLVARMDGVEAKLAEAPEFMVASKLGEMELREDYAEALEREYCRWARRLSDTLAAPLNPYCARFNGGAQPLNVRVVG